MRLRNGEHGYGVVTKTLHWLTVAAITGQFAVGLTMEADDAAFDREDDRIDALEDELDAREDNYVATAFDQPGVSLPEIHVVLGLSILALGVLRVLWRGTTPLPPWAGHLSHVERRFEAWLEKVLMALLFVVPVSGLVLKHTVVHRHGHLRRML